MNAADPVASARIPNAGHRNMNPAGISFWALVAEDFATHGRDPASQGFWALFWHRFGNWRMSVGPRLLRAPLTVLYRTMAKLCEWVCGIYLPYTVVVGRRVKLEHFGGMILVANRIGDDVIIRQNTTFGIASLDDLYGRPDIGDRVEVGAGAVVIGPIVIGPDTVIGANAVVTKSLPSGIVAAGVPARVLRERCSPHAHG
jgi:serine O-acetyltransferase